MQLGKLQIGASLKRLLNCIFSLSRRYFPHCWFHHLNQRGPKSRKWIILCRTFVLVQRVAHSGMNERFGECFAHPLLVYEVPRALVVSGFYGLAQERQGILWC